MKKIYISDTTLRINRTGAEAPLSFKEKIEIARNLDKMQVDVIELAPIENEKTDVVRTPKGLEVAFSPDWSVDKLFGAYSDAACTQPVPEEPDTNADVTVYIKWDE